MCHCTNPKLLNFTFKSVFFSKVLTFQPPNKAKVFISISFVRLITLFCYQCSALIKKHCNLPNDHNRIFVILQRLVINAYFQIKIGKLFFTLLDMLKKKTITTKCYLQRRRLELIQCR